MRYHGELIREVLLLHDRLDGAVRELGGYTNGLEDQPTLNEAGEVWSAGRRSRAHARRRGTAGFGRLLPRVTRRHRSAEDSGRAEHGQECVVACLHTCCQTSGHGVTIGPALPIAVRPELRKRRRAAADSGERQRLRRIRNRLRHHAIRAVGELIDAPQLFRSAGEGGQDHQLGVPGGRERAVGARNRDLEKRRSGIAADIGDRGERPLLLRLNHVGRHAHVDGAGRPVGADLCGVLRGIGRDGPGDPRPGRRDRRRPRPPPTGTPCTAISSAVPVRADWIS